MQVFFTQWWVQIIVAIVVGVLSPYIAEFISSCFAIVSEKWRNRTVRKEEERKQKIEALVDDKEAQRDLIDEEFRDRINLIYYGLLALYFISSVLPDLKNIDYRDPLKPTVILMFIYLIVGSMSTYAKCLDLRNLVEAAKKIEK